MDIIKNVSGSNIDIEDSNGDKIVDISLSGDIEEKKELPSGYTQVDYIESTGTQYIDSLYTPNYNTKIYCKFAHNENASDTPVFGCRAASNANQYILWSHPVGYSSNTSVIFNSTSVSLTNVAEVNEAIEFEYDKTGGSYKSTFWTWSPANASPNVNLIIFGLRNNTAIDGRKFKGKMWSFKIWDNNNLVRNMIPCYRNSDNAVGMYDTVNGVFYANSGTGSFTYGSIITPPNPDHPVKINVVSGRQDVVVEGKNILPQDKYIATTTVNHITFTNNGDGTFDLTGTASANTTIQITPIGEMELEANQPYYLYSSVSYNVNTFNMSICMTDNGTTKYILANSTYTPTTTPTNERLQFYIASGKTVNATNIKIMLVKGSTAPATYEPYQSQSYEINLGKNLFDKDNYNIAYGYTSGGLTLNNAVTGNSDRGVWFKVEPNTTYTYTQSKTNAGTDKIIGFYNQQPTTSGITAKSRQVFSTSATSIQYTFTTDNQYTYVHIKFYSTGNTTTTYTFDEMIESIQLEKGKTATSYASYKEPIELCKIGDYQDRIFKSSGKNLFDKSTMVLDAYINATGYVLTSNASMKVAYAPCEPNTTYTISKVQSARFIIATYPDLTFGSGSTNGRTDNGATHLKIRTDANAKYLCVFYYHTSDTLSEETIRNSIMINEGSTALPYEPYGTGWFIEKQTNKVDLSTLTWLNRAGTFSYTKQLTDIKYVSSNQQVGDGLAESYRLRQGSGMSSTTWYGYMAIDTSQITVNPGADTFEPSGMFYYALKTPTYTEITDSELISQLNALEQAQVPYGIAHINVSGDLPTILDLDYYTLDRYITPEDRQALLDGSATIPFRINIIKDGEVIKTLDEYSIVELDYEDFRYVDSESIVIGQFVARKITGKLDQIYTEFEIEDTELEVQIGVSYNNNTTYYSLGNFLVIKPTTDDVKEKTEFEAMDYTKKFNKKFDDTNLIFPCTALELAQYTCDLCGVELGTTSFANDDFIIQDNQYVEGDTCRKVMQDIGKLAYSWVRIDWDNKCYIDFDTKDSIIDYNRITNTEYYDLSLQREVLGPVNRVVIGIRDVDGENAVIEDSDSIEEYGVTEIQLYDNNLTYTPELRLQAIQAATRLFGLTYLPLETNTIGHPWLIGNERIEVKDMNDNLLYTYPWDRTIAYNGHIKSKLVSKADTKTETEYRNYGDLETATRQTRIIVDKQNQTIEALAEAVQPISNEISNVGSITLENAYEGTLHRLEIKGSISALFPSTTLYPSTTSYPLTPTLKVDNTLYVLGFTTLRYINSSTCDLYVYEDGKQWVERNIGVDGGGNLYELPDNEKYIEELPDITIQVSSSSVISLDGFANANLKALYLLENDYTDTFATNVDLVSKINISPSNIAIQSHKIALEGYTTINGNFWVDLEGNMHARSGSFEGNIMLPNGGRVIGGDGLFSCLAYTSTGRFSNWDIIGFGTSGANVSDTDVRYADIFVNAYIPENFTITGAYAILEVTSVNSSYTDASGDYEVVGTPKDIGLLVGVGGTSVTFFYYPYQAVDEEVEYSGTEIPNAFGNGRYTPSINSPGSVEEAKSIDIKDYLTVGEMNTIFVRSLLSPKPVVKTFTPSGGSYTMYNYEELVRNTGVGRLNLFVFGYMSTDAEE